MAEEITENMVLDRTALRTRITDARLSLIDKNNTQIELTKKQLSVSKLTETELKNAKLKIEVTQSNLVNTNKSIQNISKEQSLLDRKLIANCHDKLLSKPFKLGGSNGTFYPILLNGINNKTVKLNIIKADSTEEDYLSAELSIVGSNFKNSICSIKENFHKYGNKIYMGLVSPKMWCELNGESGFTCEYYQGFYLRGNATYVIKISNGAVLEKLASNFKRELADTITVSYGQDVMVFNTLTESELIAILSTL